MTFYEPPKDVNVKCSTHGNHSLLLAIVSTIKVCNRSEIISILKALKVLDDNFCIVMYALNDMQC